MVIHLISFLINVLDYIVNNSPMHYSFILFILTSQTQSSSEMMHFSHYPRKPNKSHYLFLSYSKVHHNMNKITCCYFNYIQTLKEEELTSSVQFAEILSTFSQLFGV